MQPRSNTPKFTLKSLEKGEIGMFPQALALTQGI